MKNTTEKQKHIHHKTTLIIHNGFDFLRTVVIKKFQNSGMPCVMFYVFYRPMEENLEICSMNLETCSHGYMGIKFEDEKEIHIQYLLPLIFPND